MKESWTQLSFTRNMLTQNKLSPHLREPNFHDSFRKLSKNMLF